MVAVFAVILNHLAGWPSAGFVGVDVFFVVSGYLIVGLLLREYDQTGSVSFRAFYARRAKRILPGAVLVLVLVDLMSYVLTPGARFDRTGADVAWAFAFLANWHFERLGTNYFAQGLPPSPVQHFWTLSVEEQFYLVAPWLLLLILAFGVRKLRWDRRGRSIVAGVVLGLLSLCSFILAMRMSGGSATAAYFSSPARAWELGVGASLAVVATAGRTGAGRRLRTVLAWAGLSGIVVSCFIVPQGGYRPLWMLLPVISTALIVTAGRSEEPRIWPLTNRISTYFGDISYSLYLWHFPVIVFAVVLVARGTTMYYVTTVALIFGLAVASYHGLEDPVRRLAGAQFRQPIVARRVLRRGAPALAAVGSIGVALLIVGLSVNPPSTLNTAALSARDLQCLGAPHLANPACRSVSLGDGVLPGVASYSRDTGGPFNCWIPAGAPVRVCRYGSTSSNALRIALVGDSHAESLLPMLLTPPYSTRWHVDGFVGDRCEWRAGACAAMPAIQSRLLSGRPYDIVITTARRAYSAAASTESYLRLWRPVAARGSAIVVMADVPGVGEGAFECINRLVFRATDSCQTPVADAFSSPDVLVDAAAALPSARVIGTRQYFCRLTECPAVIGNVIVYRDLSAHVTATFMRSLAPYLDAAILRAVGR